MRSIVIRICLAIAVCALLLIIQTTSTNFSEVLSFDAYAGDDNNEDMRIKDQVIARLVDSNYVIPYGMKMKKSNRFSQCKEKKKRNKKKCNAQLVDFDLMTFKITDPLMTVEQAIDSLNKTGDYVYAEPDYLMQETAVPNDPLYSQQWGLNSPHETDPDIDAPSAWDITTGDSDVVVAIIDGGVDYTHPDLASSMWTNENEIPGDGIDNDLNGVIDDYYGFDAHNDDGDPMDDRGHGTHLAGIIGAASNNGIGVSGVSWNSSIMAVKYLDQNGSGSISDAIDAINYVIDMHDRGVNVKITNNSWGGRTFSQSLNDAISALADKDILFVASSGNDFSDLEFFPYYPASYKQPNIMVVGMHGDVNQLIIASNTGRSIVDISAPGENIISTALVNGASVCQDPDQDGYSECTGTSMSTAYATGVAALVKSIYPNDSSQDLIDRIIRSTKPSFVTTRFAIPWTDRSATGGILDADGALAYNGLTTWPRKFYIEVERPYQLDESIQITKEINLSSLSDNTHTWSLGADVSWINPNQVSGNVIADLDTIVNLDIQSEFEFGLTSGNLTVNNLSESASFDIPVTVRTRLQTLDLIEKALDSPYALDELGFAVDIDGDVAVISAPGEAVNAASGGSVYVFRQQSDSTWLLEATLTGSDSIAGDRFGHDVAISGNKIVVGAGNNDSAASESGAAYIFEYQAGQWLETQKLLPIGADIQNDLFGQAVAIDGDNIVVGAPEITVSFSPGAADRRGSAYIYNYQGGEWIQQIKLLQPDTLLNQYVRFGAAVDIQGSKALVSSLYHPDDNAVTSRTSGRVHAYAFENDVWNLNQTIVPPQTGVELFGYQVGLNDEELAISAPEASNELGIKIGSVFTYNQIGNVWELGQQISPPDIDNDSVGFGISMDLDQDRIIVGAPSDGVKAINSGSAYAFKRVNNQWVPDGRLLPESAFSFSQLNYGRDVAVSTKATVVGAGLKTASNIPTSGYLYEFPVKTPYLETITVNNVGADWVNVSLQNEYQQMVVVCTPNYVNNISPIVVRMQNVNTQNFEIKLQNPGDKDIVFAEKISCLIIEQGVWLLPNGRKIEAKKVNSSVTDNRKSWLGEQQDYGHDYTFSSRPVLLGQVMSYNDPNWSVFWSKGPSRTKPITKKSLFVGKHIGSDADTSREIEDIGYIAIELSEGIVDGIDYIARITPDRIKNLGSGDTNLISLSFSTLPAFAILSQTAMDGGDGSWSVLEGFEGLSFGQLRIAVDEDQIQHVSRNHGTENVFYFTASEHLNIELLPAE